MTSHSQISLECQPPVAFSDPQPDTTPLNHLPGGSSTVTPNSNQTQEGVSSYSKSIEVKPALGINEINGLQNRRSNIQADQGNQEIVRRPAKWRVSAFSFEQLVDPGSHRDPSLLQWPTGPTPKTFATLSDRREPPVRKERTSRSIQCRAHQREIPEWAEVTVRRQSGDRCQRHNRHGMLQPVAHLECEASQVPFRTCRVASSLWRKGRIPARAGAGRA